jgi:class 3 adenylate cyclase
MPEHVLASILNDKRVIDLVDNVTLLYTDMVGFTEYSEKT